MHAETGLTGWQDRGPRLNVACYGKAVIYVAPGLPIRPQASQRSTCRTIGRQLELAIRRRPESPPDMGREISAILQDVGLASWTAKSLPGELSGGMCQRAALAVAIAPTPKVVIADEPETGLDPVLRRGVVELLVEVCKGRGAGLQSVTTWIPSNGLLIQWFGCPTKR